MEYAESISSAEQESLAESLGPLLEEGEIPLFLTPAKIRFTHFYLLLTDQRGLRIDTQTYALDSEAFRYENIKDIADLMGTVVITQKGAKDFAVVIEKSDRKKVVELVKEYKEFFAPSTDSEPGKGSVDYDAFFAETDVAINMMAFTKKYGFSKAAKKAIYENSMNGKAPWFVIASGTMGTLAAYENELIIAKTGAMTGLMSSVTFDGRFWGLKREFCVGICLQNAGF